MHETLLYTGQQRRGKLLPSDPAEVKQGGSSTEALDRASKVFRKTLAKELKKLKKTG
jgi:hypothetical protein